jgi:hypothetical protein
LGISLVIDRHAIRGTLLLRKPQVSGNDERGDGQEECLLHVLKPISEPASLLRDSKLRNT